MVQPNETDDVIDISTLTEDQIDEIDPAMLRELLKSIMRRRGPEAMHKNHNSHSNVQVKEEEEPGDVQ